MNTNLLVTTFICIVCKKEKRANTALQENILLNCECPKVLVILGTLCVRPLLEPVELYMEKA